MLNITPQSNAEGAKSYFAKSDYYASADEQEIIGNWGGKGAEMLKLRGKVDKAAFDMLCDNRHPTSGKQLTKVTRDGRRVGFDFTWSAPKSVSVVHAITGDQAIMEVFRESIADTMQEMEEDMQARVRKGKQDYDRTTGNMCHAEFVHLVSRPTNGVPCPQLHAHIFTFNMTFDPIEEQWKAGQFGKIKGDAYYWQAVQQARFADGLQKLGYSIRKTKDAFEIEGVPSSALKKFSLRANLIDQVAEKLGITNPKSKAKLAATTREAKDSSVPYRDLVEIWNRQLDSDESDAIHAISPNKPQQWTKHDDAAHAAFAINHAFERASVVDERRLLTLALRHGIGEVTPEGIREAMDGHRLLKRDDVGKTWVTTRGILAEEKRMIEFAVQGKGSCKPVAAKGELRFKEERLNEGQLRAVEHVLTSRDRVMLIRGAAGTGKSTLTREAVAQLEARGRSVAMLAPSAEASRGVLRAEGFKEADTLARFLLDEKMQAGVTDGFIWLDEAGLVGTQSLVKLFDVAERLNARVVLSGDKRQMASVERGSALHVLESIAHLPAAEVTEIQRQKPRDYREIVALLAQGNVEEGFNRLDALGCVQELPEVDSYQPIAKDYIDAIRGGKSVLIVSPTHAEGQLITSTVRSQLKQEQLLGAEERDFMRLVPKQWTAAEKGNLTQYTGDEVCCSTTTRRFSKPVNECWRAKRCRCSLRRNPSTSPSTMWSRLA